MSVGHLSDVERNGAIPNVFLDMQTIFIAKSTAFPRVWSIRHLNNSLIFLKVNILDIALADFVY